MKYEQLQSAFLPDALGFVLGTTAEAYQLVSQIMVGLMLIVMVVHFARQVLVMYYYQAGTLPINWSEDPREHTKFWLAEQIPLGLVFLLTLVISWLNPMVLSAGLTLTELVAP